LLEANLLDNRNPEVWCYIAVLCLALGSHRLVESEKALYQGLRLNVSNASLLRELATLYISYDKLVVAEDLVRRSLVLETKSNGRARKLLADILASQNEKAKAIDEYSFVINDSETDITTKVNAAEKCISLLAALGRKSEVNQLTQILQSLNQQLKEYDSVVQE
jgi:lipopolysaccharide biosynthesis regulator YciM